MLYELRTYKAVPGRMPALQSRFRDHTLRLFERHGIHSVVYWTNMVGGHNDELTYLVSYESMAAREAAWRGFIGDPEWQAVFKESTAAAGGLLNEWVDNRFLTATDFSPVDHGGPSETPRLFEWRSYTAALDRMPDLLSRFRNTTVAKFSELGATNVGYWLNAVGGRNDELQYVLAFRDMAHREEMWETFGNDPEWQRARSESNVNGNLVAHLSNTFMVATDYSPLR
jgi:hypothetical protein